MEKRFTIIRAPHYVLLRIMFTATPDEKLCFSGGAHIKEGGFAGIKIELNFEI